MPKIKINERGKHTSVIEGGKDVYKILQKLSVRISPGVIEANIGSKGKIVKLKKINNETFEMVIVFNGSKQTFKLYSVEQSLITGALSSFRSRGWNIQDVLDISNSQ